MSIGQVKAVVAGFKELPDDLSAEQAGAPGRSGAP